MTTENATKTNETTVTDTKDMGLDAVKEELNSTMNEVCSTLCMLCMLGMHEAHVLLELSCTETVEDLKLMIHTLDVYGDGFKRAKTALEIVVGDSEKLKSSETYVVLGRLMTITARASLLWARAIELKFPNHHAHEN